MRAIAAVTAAAIIPAVDRVILSQNSCCDLYRIKINASAAELVQKHVRPLQSLWFQKNCGHIVVGTKAPDICPGDDKAVAVYAYCNLHSLWMTEV